MNPLWVIYLIGLTLLVGCSRDRVIYCELSKTPDGQIYIPTDLEDCFSVLTESIDESSIARIKGRKIEPYEMHDGFGMMLRNGWGLWKGSRLAEYFDDLGIFHPEDMSAIILHSYPRHLRGEPIQLERQIEYYKAFWKENSSPEPFQDPQSGHTVNKVEDGIISVTFEDGRTIHIGEDQVTGEAWYFHHKRGWFRPTIEEIREVEQATGDNP